MELSAILKPEYFYQPQVALRRILPFKQYSTPEFVQQNLPWRIPIRVRPLEEHGRMLSTLGVIDLAVTETLFRLAEPGEIAVDVGANIGYMTAVLAVRLNSILGGKVYSFEPHPEIFEELKYNVELWQQKLNAIKFDIQQIAISDKPGTVTLEMPESFAVNRGLASVVNLEKASHQISSASLNTVTVKSASLDELFPAPQKIGVLKLDVEGHEINVLKGATQLFQEQRIRDCVFEEHRNYPTDVSHFFEDKGYCVFRIQRQFFGPKLLEANSQVARISWQPTSFLATQQPERAMKCFKKRGWKALRWK